MPSATTMTGVSPVLRDGGRRPRRRLPVGSASSGAAATSRVEPQRPRARVHDLVGHQRAGLDERPTLRCAGDPGRILRPVEHDRARDAVHAKRITHGAREALDHRLGCRRRRACVVDDASRSAPGRRRRPPPTARRSRPPRRPPRSARGSGAASPRPGRPGARRSSRRRAISRASGSPGSVYGIHRTWSPNRSRAIASPSCAQVRALTVVGWVWITNRRGMSAWNTHSTDGRRAPSSRSRAAIATRITGSLPAVGLAGRLREGKQRAPSRAASASPAVIEASETPLGLMYSVPPCLTELLPPPARAYSGSSPNRRDSRAPASSRSAARRRRVHDHRRPYSGPKLAQARKSAPSRSAVPRFDHADGRKTSSSGTLCMWTGIRRIEARLIRSAPMWP